MTQPANRRLATEQRVTDAVAGKADTTDSRLTDQRVPTNGSVTDAKVASGAAISADKLADGTGNKVLTAAERTKLAGVATGATANATDATLLARANHTGTQAATTITGLATVATSGVYADLSGKPTIPAAPGDIGAQPAGDYATNTALTTGLAGKQDKAITLVTATGTADSAAIMAAFNSMKVAGKATGTLVIKGHAALDTALDFDGGYSDVENTANWATAGNEQFRVVVYGSLTPAAGLGSAVKVHGFNGAVIDLTFRGGGQASDNALDVYNLLQADITVNAMNFAGTVLHGDTYVSTTNDSTRRIRVSRINKLYANSCGRALYWRGFESFGVIEDVWDNNCANGSYIGFCADFRIGHYETFNPVSQTVGLLMEGCNNVNGGVITMGDRASTCLLKILGNTTDPAGVVQSSDFGSLERIRASCFLVGGVQTYEAIQIVDVHYIDVDNVWTFRATKGLHITGSNVRVKSHYSQSADLNALVVEGDAYNAAPIVEIGARYRFTAADPVTMASSITGGVVKVSGHIESSVASAGTTGVYAINSASTGALDVANLTQDAKTGLTFTNHPGTLRGTAVARTGNNPPAKGTLWVADGNGNQTQVAPGSNGQVLGYGASGAVAPVTPGGGGGGGGTSYFDPATYTTFLAWTQDPVTCGQGTVGMVTSKPQYSLIPVSSSITATNLSVLLATAGSATTWTTGQNFLALYDSTGNLLGQTADITSVLSATAANTEIRVALATPATIAAGRVYAVCLFNWSAGTAPTLFAAKTLAGGSTNLGTPTAFPRSAQDSVARTAPVANKAITALSASQQSLMWAAIS